MIVKVACRRESMPQVKHATANLRISVGGSDVLHAARRWGESSMIVLSNTRVDPRFLRSLAILSAVSLLLLAGSQAGAQESDRYTISGRDIAVYNIAGTVTVETGSDREVVVELEYHGADSRALEVAVDRINGRETLRVIYPDDRIVYREMSRFSRTDMSVRRDGTFGGSGYGAHRVRITGSGSGLEAWADVRIRVPAERDLAVYIGVGEITATDVTGDFRLDTYSGDVHATRVRGSLLVDTGSGRVTCNEIEGDLDIDTGSGRVDVYDVSGESIRLDTGSGRVTGEGVRAGRLVVDTGSGGIVIDGLAAEDIVLDTGSGSVTVELLEGVRRMIVDTGSGGVTVQVPRNINAELEIDVGSGGIDVDIPIDYRRRSRSYVLGTLGSGNGRIYIDTGSGSVRIHPR